MKNDRRVKKKKLKVNHVCNSLHLYLFRIFNVCPLATSRINHFQRIEVNCPLFFQPFYLLFLLLVWIFVHVFVAKFNRGLLFTEGELRGEQGDIQQQGRPDELGRHDNETQM